MRGTSVPNPPAFSTTIPSGENNNVYATVGLVSPGGGVEIHQWARWPLLTHRPDRPRHSLRPWITLACRPRIAGGAGFTQWARITEPPGFADWHLLTTGPLVTCCPLGPWGAGHYPRVTYRTSRAGLPH